MYKFKDLHSLIGQNFICESSNRIISGKLECIKVYKNSMQAELKDKTADCIYVVDTDKLKLECEE